MRCSRRSPGAPAAATAQGTVLIQTEFPGPSAVRGAASGQDYRAFADSLLAERRQAGFPPFVHQALLRAEAPQLATALEFLGAAARRRATARRAGDDLRPGAGGDAAPRRTRARAAAGAVRIAARLQRFLQRLARGVWRRSAPRARAGRSTSIRSSSDVPQSRSGCENAVTQQRYVKISALPRRLNTEQHR